MFLSSLFPNPPGQTPALLARRAERIEGKGTKEEDNKFFFFFFVFLSNSDLEFLLCSVFAMVFCTDVGANTLATLRDASVCA